MVVAGGAIAQPSGQVLINFIKEICHENRENCPEVVLLALRPPSDELKAGAYTRPLLSSS